MYCGSSPCSPLMNATPMRASQKRVFAVCFLASSPARVAENIDVRRPERQAAEPFAIAIVLGGVIVVFRAAFDADDGRFLMNQSRVPGGGHADGLRKHCRDAVGGHAMQRFIPIVVSRQAKPRNCGCAVTQLGDFLRQRHPADQIVHARCNGCDGSRQMGGSLISGMRLAVAEKGSASSEALKAKTNSPEPFFTSNVLNFAVFLPAVKVTVSGPLSESSTCSTSPVMVQTFFCAAGGGDDVEIFGQRDVAGSHVKHPFARLVHQCFHFADGKGIFARRQMRDADREISSGDFLAKRCSIL